MQRVEAMVKPELLVWARRSLHISTAEIAKKIHKDIIAWEKGQKRPSIAQLRKLAKTYKRPLAVFFLPGPPTTEKLPADFRNLPSRRDYPLSKKSLLAIRRSRRIQEIAKELSQELGEKKRFDFVTASVNDNPEKISWKARKKLGITLDTQFSWQDRREALKAWKKALENSGIFVLEQSMPIEEARGLSFYDSENPIIVINTKDSPSARIFSLFHELGHLILKVSGISDLTEKNFSEKRIRQQEIFCNYFAGAFLVPAENLHEAVSGKSRKEWPDELIRKLANRFNVSREVILRRLLILGLATRAFYQEKQAEYRKEYDFLEKKKGGRRDIVRDCIRDNGHSFINLVYESVNAGNITYRDMADYLKISPKYLPELEKRSWGGQVNHQ